MLQEEHSGNDQTARMYSLSPYPGKTTSGKVAFCKSSLERIPFEDQSGRFTTLVIDHEHIVSPPELAEIGPKILAREGLQVRVLAVIVIDLSNPVLLLIDPGHLPRIPGILLIHRIKIYDETWLAVVHLIAAPFVGVFLYLLADFANPHFS